MRKTVSIICAVMFIIVGQAWASQVTNVSLQCQEGFTVARIDIQGAVRFTHQTEEAKDGKPFRVIVDVLLATHQLPAKDFVSLPKCPVEKIRTSQYSVKPEKIVRLVFDMEKETIYRVDSDDKSITLFFPDKGRRKFSNWSSTASVAASTRPSRPTASAAATKTSRSEKSVAEINEAIDNDRLLSLAGEHSSTPTVAEPDKKKQAPVVGEQKPTSPKSSKAESSPDVPKVKQTPTLAVDVPYGPEIDSNLSEPPTPEPLVDASSAPKGPADKSSTIDRRQPGTKKSTSASVKKQPAASEKPAVDKPVADASQRGPTLASTDNQKETEKGAQKEVAAGRDLAVGQKKAKKTQDSTATLKDEESVKKKKPTSRFRRSPTRPTKIKGTLVAEFPKRLVIKYKTRSYRDPFETLINEAKIYNSPIEKRIPNVEGLKLVGVLESEAGLNSALFEDKEGYGYILREGDKVQKGYVLRVEHNRVYFQIFEYGWSRTFALNIDED